MNDAAPGGAQVSSDAEGEAPFTLADLPAAVRSALAGARWREVTFGFSGDRVWRIEHPGRKTRYLKGVTGPWQRTEAVAEHDVLRWLHGRLPVPAVEVFARDATATYLLVSEMPGIMSCDETWATCVPAVVRALAEGMRLIHQVSIVDCPFDQRLERKLALAEQRVHAGLVDESDFDDDHLGMRASDLFEAVVRLRPASEDLVFTHGDYCLPNVLVEGPDARLSGILDWGRAGVADRHQDLALAARSLAHNFGPASVPLLWQAYGIAQPDEALLRFYRTLDEFF